MNIFEELQKATVELAKAVYETPEIARHNASANARYEEAKNKELVAMSVEEASPNFTGKRTESIRQAIYRNNNKELREEAMLARNIYEAHRTHVQGLIALVSSYQSMLNHERATDQASYKIAA